MSFYERVVSLFFIPVLLTLFIAFPLSAFASNFEIAPVILELSANKTAGVIRIVNKDEHTISLQFRSYEWLQIDGEDQLNSTEAIVISPPIFTVAAGAAQTIRVVSRKPTAISSELAYRLLIDEIPTETDQPAVNFKFRISMPVFVEPDKLQAPQLTWKVDLGSNVNPNPQLTATAASQASISASTSAAQPVQALTVKNLGARRAKLLNIAIALPDGRRLIPKSAANPYVLAGAQRRYELAPDPDLKPGIPIKIYATADSGPLEIDSIVMP